MPPGGTIAEVGSNDRWQELIARYQDIWGKPVGPDFEYAVQTFVQSGGDITPLTSLQLQSMGHAFKLHLARRRFWGDFNEWLKTDHPIGSNPVPPNLVNRGSALGIVRKAIYIYATQVYDLMLVAHRDIVTPLREPIANLMYTLEGTDISLKQAWRALVFAWKEHGIDQAMRHVEHRLEELDDKTTVKINAVLARSDVTVDTDEYRTISLLDHILRNIINNLSTPLIGLRYRMKSLSIKESTSFRLNAGVLGTNMGIWNDQLHLLALQTNRYKLLAWADGAENMFWNPLESALSPLTNATDRTKDAMRMRTWQELQTQRAGLVRTAEVLERDAHSLGTHAEEHLRLLAQHTPASPALDSDLKVEKHQLIDLIQRADGIVGIIQGLLRDAEGPDDMDGLAKEFTTRAERWQIVKGAALAEFSDMPPLEYAEKFLGAQVQANAMLASDMNQGALRKTLLHLASNARRTAKIIEVRVQPDYISVWDDGQGMDEETVARINAGEDIESGHGSTAVGIHQVRNEFLPQMFPGTDITPRLEYVSSPGQGCEAFIRFGRAVLKPA